MQVNPLTREVLLKVVYYGPGLGGKTTSLQHVHATAPAESRGEMVSLATPVDRTLYFDFLPLRVARVRDHHVRLQLFTVPGQVYFNATRKLVLTGADGVVFVADSQTARHDANVESYQNLHTNLREQGRQLENLPHVIQLNKRDLPDVVSEAELSRTLNVHGAPLFPSVATAGKGVLEALDALVQRLLQRLEEEQVFGPASEPPPELQLGRADQALEEQIGLASEQIWRTTVQRAIETRRHESPASARPDGPVVDEPTDDSTGNGSAVPPVVGIDSPEPVLEPTGEAAIPIAPMPAEAARARTAGGPSWASLFEEEREAVEIVERDLVAGHLADAIVRCDGVAQRLLGRMAAELGAGEVAPAVAALLLGVPGGRWLAFQRIAKRARSGGLVNERDALAAFATVVDLRLRWTDL